MFLISKWDIRIYEYFIYKKIKKTAKRTYRKENDCQNDKKIKHEKGFA